MLRQTEVTRYEDSVERKESLKHREHIEHRTRQTEREKQRIQRERVKKGLMCFCILMVCVGTVVMAMDSLRISKRANAEVPMNQTAEVRVDVKEDSVRQTPGQPGAPGRPAAAGLIASRRKRHRIRIAKGAGRKPGPRFAFPPPFYQKTRCNHAHSD